MEIAAPSDESQPLATIVDDFTTVYDVPFVTVNRVWDGEYEAEVVFSGNPATDGDRVRTALAVGRDHGVRAYARVFVEDYVIIQFSDHPDKGIIWCPDEMNDAWLR